MQVEEKIKKELIETAKQAFKIKLTLEEIILNFPPSIELGDFCFSCFQIAQKISKNPNEVAKTIADNFNLDCIEKVQAMGPYINFKIKNEILFKEVIVDININGIKEKAGKKEKIMIEYLSPNTNKPLHLGHLRNGALGLAMGKILKSNGNKVVMANLVNDRGVHICKSMLAWLKWGQGETPETAKMKGDHFVGKWYVRYATE
ncbi:MAG: arginine--tRNA ligase, partial [bacterium]|nr:arginine--tRNA ligase [bacterium]